MSSELARMEQSFKEIIDIYHGIRKGVKKYTQS
jgi:hypothetical protein